jgi:hypothetical protein
MPHLYSTTPMQYKYYKYMYKYSTTNYEYEVYLLVPRFES